ncbi:MAG: ABC transporter ATP-binding protein [Lachnospiraceae bacterium]|nr:ABC transporter ATP-binding protein [Lachnospiraceae bacterium]
MIQLIDVTKTYNTGKSEVHALKGISLEIPDNTFISICGKSGSGKSTLLNMISGADKPTGGHVFIDGVDINQLSDKRMSEMRNNKIGFVFQSFLLEPSLTALENVELPLLMRKMSREQREKIAIEMLDKVGLRERLRHKPGELSGGEKQRVSIARALAISPKILIADEPTGNLDEATGNSIMELIREHTKNCTFVLVTHDTALAQTADMKITIKDGMISRND